MVLPDLRVDDVADPVPAAAPRGRTRVDVLFIASMGLLLAIHAIVYVATLVIAPITRDEQQSLDLLHLPVVAARLLTLPFEVVLLCSLYVLGARAAGRWAGLAAIFAIFSLDLRSDPPAVAVWGPSVATGGLAAAALLAAALVLLPRRRLAAAALIGLAAVLHGLTVLALPAFLIALALFPLPRGRGGAARLADLLRFAGAWFIPFAIGQLVWLLDLGPARYASRAAVYLAEFGPHGFIDIWEQQKLTFQSWHFPFGLTISFAVFLFGTAAVAVVRYFMTPTPAESRADAVDVPRALLWFRRLPLEYWAGGLSLVLFSTWWSFSGGTVVIEPNLPVLLAVVPIVTALAYRGAKWLLTIPGFWRLFAIVYLIGLVLARGAQMILTLIQAFKS